MRHNEEPKTPLAKYLRDVRMKQVVPQTKFRGKGWAMTQADFCDLLNTVIAGRPLGRSTYIRMENGFNPSVRNEQRVREAVEKLFDKKEA